MQDAAKGSFFVFIPSRVLSHELHDLEARDWEEARRISDRTLKGFKGTWVLLTAFQSLIKKLVHGLLGMSHPWIPKTGSWATLSTPGAS